MVKEYKRDTRSPKPKNESVSRVMSANKAKNTKPEMILRQRLYLEGIRGYRLHHKLIPGRPDIVFTRSKVAIFVNGCYWHRCPKCALPLPKHNTDFWKNKFEKNIARDKRKASDLELLKYKVILVWECEIKKELDLVIKRIKDALRENE